MSRNMEQSLKYTCTLAAAKLWHKSAGKLLAFKLPDLEDSVV